MDAPIFTGAEAWFLRAQAILSGDLVGSAQTAYESGIEASFDYLGATGAATYYGQNIENVGWNASTNKLEAIITQKWIGLNGVDAIQSWFDYTKTGYPSDLPISALATTPERPVRLLYPASEITANPNVPSQSNAFSDKIFWAN
jgi:hypothetical protein